MNERFHQATSAIPELFKQLAASEAFTAKGIVSQRGRPGVYVFYENGVPVHAGRTRNLEGRLRGHVSRSHYSASFAFKRARRALDRVATYVTKGSRSDLSMDEIFGPEFHRQIELVPLDEFDTH